MKQTIEDFLQKQINQFIDDKSQEKYRCINLKDTHLSLEDAERVADYLDYVNVQLDELNLSNTGLECNRPVYLKTIDAECNRLQLLLPLLLISQVTKLDLSDNVIGDQGVKKLSEMLKISNVTSLNLNCTDVGNEGVKYLSEVLSETRVTELSLSRNYRIRDLGAEYLAKGIKNSTISRLELANTNIGILGAKALNEALRISTVKSCFLEVNFHNNIFNNGLLQHCAFDVNNITVKLKRNSIGMFGAKYINETYKTTGITRLNLHDETLLQEEDIEYISEAFKGIKICHYDLAWKHLEQPEGVRFLIEIFKNSTIVSLKVRGEQPISSFGAELVAQMLSQVNIIDLDLSSNFIRDEGVKYLAPMLENTGINFINLSENNIGPKGVDYLSKRLSKSSLISIVLSNNTIKNEGAKHLAKGLKDSQVTHVFLNNCSIELEGFHYFLLNDVVDDSNHGCKFNPNNFIITTKNCNIGQKIINMFNKIVKQNDCGDFKFIKPTRDLFFRLEECLTLIKFVVDKPNIIVHIFVACCKIQNRYTSFDFDVEKMLKIKNFAMTIEDEFLYLFKSKQKELITLFNDVEYFVNLVKQSDDMGLTNLVKGLLQYKGLYVVNPAPADDSLQQPVVQNNDGDNDIANSHGNESANMEHNQDTDTSAADTANGNGGTVINMDDDNSNEDDNGAADVTGYSDDDANMEFDDLSCNDVALVGNNIGNVTEDDNEYEEFLHPYIYLMLDKHGLLSSDEQNKTEKIIAFFKNHLVIDGAHEVIDLLCSKYLFNVSS